MPVLPRVGSRMIESGREQAARLEVLHEVLRRAILDRAGRVVHLELGEDPDARVGAHARDLDQRRVPDRVEDVRVAPAMGCHSLVGVHLHVGPIVDRTDGGHGLTVLRVAAVSCRRPWPAG